MPKLIYASTKDSDMLYALRIPIADPFVFLDTGRRRLVFLDSREYEFVKRENTNKKLTILPLEAVVKKARERKEQASGLCRLVLQILESYKLQKQTIEVPASFPLPLADSLRAQKISLVVRQPFWEQREIKQANELRAIQKSIAATQKAFALIEKVLKESTIKHNLLHYQGVTLTSEYLKTKVDQLFFERGMISPEGMIISSGAHSAIPHHPGKGAIKAHEPIVCDMFPRDKKTGYFADLTRSFIKGDPSKKLHHMYSTVKEVGEKITRMVKPGIETKKLHKACETLIQQAGYHVGAKGFTHATGHGVGLDVHEEPGIGLRSKSVLKTGNVITIEPGLYYPALGGIRIEDMVLVTKTGYKKLSTYPKRFILD